jgi:hypothetical protein
MYGAGDVRVETVPDARLIEPTDALPAVHRSRPAILPCHERWRHESEDVPQTREQ